MVLVLFGVDVFSWCILVGNGLFPSVIFRGILRIGNQWTDRVVVTAGLDRFQVFSLEQQFTLAACLWWLLFVISLF